jgi:hypothetical protein
VSRHADYPHAPGALYDCPACETTCFCGGDGSCVSCAIAAEGTPTARTPEQVAAYLADTRGDRPNGPCPACGAAWFGEPVGQRWHRAGCDLLAWLAEGGAAR